MRELTRTPGVDLPRVFLVGHGGGGGADDIPVPAPLRRLVWSEDALNPPRLAGFMDRGAFPPPMDLAPLLRSRRTAAARGHAVADEDDDNDHSLAIGDPFPSNPPFYYAAMNNDPSMIQLLLDNDVDINAQQAVTGDTCLHLILEDLELNTDLPERKEACERAIKLLLEHGADPNLNNSFGCTALQTAVSLGNWTLLRSLIGAGANPNDIHGEGHTTLVQACNAP